MLNYFFGSAINLSKQSTYITYTLIGAFSVACPVFGIPHLLGYEVLTTCESSNGLPL